MRFFDLHPRLLRETFTDISVSSLGIGDLINKADSELNDEAAEAIDRFVGVQSGAIDRGDWGGVMLSRQLEDAYSATPSPRGKEIRRQLESAFSPVLAELRSRFGDHITLYRAQGPVGNDAPTRHTLSWTSDPRVAAWMAGVDPRLMKVKPITDDEIQSALVSYSKDGKVRFRGKTYVQTTTPTNDPGSDEFYYEIYDRDGEMLTDGDDLRSQFLEDQRWYQELIDKRNKKLENVIKAEIPVDDIIWITDRAGQSEFILHNRPEAKGYIDTTGTLTKG